MALFTDADLDAFGALAESLALKDDCDILRAPLTNDASGGGMTRGAYVVVATVKGALIDGGMSPRRKQIAGQDVANTPKLILLPRQTDVRLLDRLGMLGQVYEIIDLYDPTTYEVLRRVSVTRLEAGAGT